ncbi:MAG: sterol desaturase family protein [Bacteroidota bacterium]
MDVVILSIPIFFVLMGLEVAWDFIHKKRGGEGKYRLNDSFTNVSCGIIDQLTGIFAKVLTVGIYALVYELFHFEWFDWSAGVLGWILAFIAVDLAYYWSHRTSHQVNLFWVGHVIHHQSEEYNLSVALRQGAFQKMLMFWVYLPLALIGITPELFAVSIGLNLLYQFWIHTEWVKSLGPFEWVLNSPSHHRVHHGRNEKYLDKNHGGVLIIWDRLFGTFQKEEEQPVYGITRPTNTFNPVYAHVQPFVRLWKDTAAIPTFKDKIQFVFRSPGWSAARGLYPEQDKQAGGEEYQKYHRSLPFALNVYLFVQYFVLVGITATFLFTFQNFSLPVQIGFVSFLLIQLLLMGNIFDSSKSALPIEIARLALWLVLGLAAGFLGFNLLAIATLIVSIASSSFVIHKRSLFQNHQ